MHRHEPADGRADRIPLASADGIPQCSAERDFFASRSAPTANAEGPCGHLEAHFVESVSMAPFAAYIAVPYIAMAYIVTAYIVMADIVMADIVMALHSYGPYSYGPTQLWPI